MVDGQRYHITTSPDSYRAKESWHIESLYDFVELKLHSTFPTQFNFIHTYLTHTRVLGLAKPGKV